MWIIFKKIRSLLVHIVIHMSTEFSLRFFLNSVPNNENGPTKTDVPDNLCTSYTQDHVEFSLILDLDVKGFGFNFFSFILHSPQFFLMSVHKYFNRNPVSPTSYFSCPQLIFNYSQVMHMLTTLKEKIEYLLRGLAILYLKISALKNFQILSFYSSLGYGRVTD